MERATHPPSNFKGCSQTLPERAKQPVPQAAARDLATALLQLGETAGSLGRVRGGKLSRGWGGGGRGASQNLFLKKPRGFLAAGARRWPSSLIKRERESGREKRENKQKKT